MYLINLKVFHIIKKHQPKVGQIPIGGQILDSRASLAPEGGREQKI